jgi:hypothetical protein
LISGARWQDFADICALVEPEAVRRHLGNRPVRAPDEFARFQRNAGSWALYGYGIASSASC